MVKHNININRCCLSLLKFLLCKSNNCAQKDNMRFLIYERQDMKSPGKSTTFQQALAVIIPLNILLLRLLFL